MPGGPEGRAHLDPPDATEARADSPARSVGGLATSAFLTLEVLPVLYTIWRCRQLRRAQDTGVLIEAVVGAVPAWARS